MIKNSYLRGKIKQGELSVGMIVFLKVYSYVSLGAILRLTVWLLLSSLFLHYAGSTSILFGKDAGQSGLLFFFLIFLVYLIRALVNYFYHVLFQRWGYTLVSQADYGDESNVAGFNARLTLFRRNIRHTPFNQVEDYLISLGQDSEGNETLSHDH